MKILALDFESYYCSRTFTLRKMTTEAYVRDPRFKAHMVGVWRPGTHPEPGDFLPALLESNDEVRKLISESAVLMHHAHFDAFILNHHYGLRPAFILDTLAMSRLVLPRLKKHNLGSLADYFGFPKKNVPYNLFDGVRDLPPDVYAAVAAGCRHDVALTYAIFQKLLPFVPKEELQVIDATVRMFTEPCLRLDRPRMAAFLQAEKIHKAKAMLEAGAVMGMPHSPAMYAPDGAALRAYLAGVETELQSSAKFQIALEALGYPCPTKWSEKAAGTCAYCGGAGVVGMAEIVNASERYMQPQRCDACNGIGKVKGGHIPALAKSDDGMKELLEHDDPRVQTLAAARLGVKSTIDETRAERLLDADTRGPLPVYLSYCLAGDTKLLIANACGIYYKRLDTLNDTDWVWDGEDFVEHGGLIYQGERSVIFWDGLTGTSDHEVYTARGKIPLGEAKNCGDRLVGAALPWQDVRQLDGDRLDSCEAESSRAVPVRVRLGGSGLHQQLKEGPDSRVPRMRDQAAAPSADREDKPQTGQLLGEHPTTLHKPEAQVVQAVWGTGDSEQICDAPRLHRLGVEEFAASDLRRHGDRSQGQRRALRAGEHSACDSRGAVPQSEPDASDRGGVPDDVLSAERIAGTLRHLPQTGLGGEEQSGVAGAYEEVRSGIVQKVYDILNCGPRHRFMANGRVVSNCSAKTLRYGGGDKTNWQNFRRGGEIRKSIKAPEGHKLVIGDLSQIEYRLLCWLTGQHDKLEALAGGRDLYSELAQKFYGYPVDKSKPKERGLGKQITLSCGYGAGDDSIKATAKNGTYGPPLDLTDEEAARAKAIYRTDHSCVTDFWKWCEWVLPVLASGGETEYRVGDRVILRVANHKIWLPNDTAIDYTGLKKARNTDIFPDQQWDGAQPCWWEPNRKGWGRIWGSKLTADIVQALARVVIIAALVKASQRIRIVLQVHDEIVGAVPDAEADAALAWMLDLLKTPLAWCPDIPLDAEGIVSDIYEK